MTAVQPSRRVMTTIAVLLTFASGASDVASFTRLGDVFTSVMTGNIVLFGLALARGSVSLAAHSAASFAGYVAGVVVATRLTWLHSNRTRGGDPAANGQGRRNMWPPHVTLTLLVESALLIVLTIGWELTSGRPTGGTRFALLACAACAMGIQSCTVQEMGISEVSTTYLTGTLTALVRSVSRPGEPAKPGLRRPGVLVGLASGAVLAGLMLASAPAVVPLLPLGAVLTAVYLGSGRTLPGLAR